MNSRLSDTKKSYLITAVFTTIVFLLVSISCHLVPFGDNTLLSYDGNDQYLNFYGYLYQILHGRGDILYSFSNVLGGNFLSLAAYYLSSPFYFIFLFLPPSHLIGAVHLITYGKYLTAALSFCYLLNYHYSGHILKKSLFSTAYAFIGFTTSYYMILNWMDGVILLPLIFVGLRKLITEKKYLLYILSLALAIISNYYIGFILCLTSVLLYVYLVFSEPYELNDTQKSFSGVLVKRLKESFWGFLISSLAGGMLSAFLWVPVYFSLPTQRLKISPEDFTEIEDDFHFLDFFSKFFTGATDAAEVEYGLPIVFFGIIPIILLVAFFANRSITVHKKSCVLVLLGILYFSFHNSMINQIWHGFTYNSAFNYRYSFVFSFLCLFFAFEGWMQISFLTTRDWWHIALAMLAGLLITLSDKPDFLTWNTIYLDIVLLLCGLIVLSHSAHHQKAIPVILCILMLGNIWINASVSISRISDGLGHATIPEYRSYLDQVNSSLDYINNNAPDDEFYRVEKLPFRTHCDNMLFGINGASNYSSTENLPLQNMLKEFGWNQEWFYAFYNHNIPASADSLFGIRYLIERPESGYSLAKGYLPIASGTEDVIYQNDTALPLAFSANTLIPELPAAYGPMQLSDMWRSLDPTFNEDLFGYGTITEKPDTAEDPMHYTADILCNEPGNLYLYVPYGKYHMYEFLNGEWVDLQYDNENLLFYLGNHTPGDVVTVSLEATNDEPISKERFLSFIERKDVLKRYADTVRLSGAHITEKTASHLVGTIVSPRDSYVATTIPYDEAWTVYVDQVPVNIQKNWGQFLAFPISSGSHTIEFVYRPKGITLGFVLSLMTLIGLIVYYRILPQKHILNRI